MERSSLNLPSSPIQHQNSELTIIQTPRPTLIDSSENTANRNISLISMINNGLKVIQKQAQTIETQEKLLQDQANMLEKLEAEIEQLHKMKKKLEQNQKKEAKPPTTVNTTSTQSYYKSSKSTWESADRLR